MLQYKGIEVNDQGYGGWSHTAWLQNLLCWILVTGTWA